MDIIKITGYIHPNQIMQFNVPVLFSLYHDPPYTAHPLWDSANFSPREYIKTVHLANKRYNS